MSAVRANTLGFLLYSGGVYECVSLRANLRRMLLCAPRHEEPFTASLLLL